MKNLLLILISICATSAYADTCKPGPTSYPRAIHQVLNDFVARTESTYMSATSGRLSVSSINEEVIAWTKDGYSSRITLHTSYGNIANNMGVQIRKVVYHLETKPDCSGFVITSVDMDPVLNVTPDTKLTVATRTALKEYLKSSDVIPLNNHSGDATIRLHTPEICSGGKLASVNIVRLHHALSGIVYRTTSYLLDLSSGQVLDSQVRPGRFLPSLCDGATP